MVRNPNIFVFHWTISSEHTFPFHIYFYDGVMSSFGDGTAPQEAEKGSEAYSRATVTPHKLCFVSRAVSCLSQEALVLETDFLWQMIWAEAQLKVFSAALTCTPRNGLREGAALKLISLIFQGCGVFPSNFFFSFFNNHIFSLSITLLTKLLPFTPRVSPLSAIWFFSNVNTQEPARGGGVIPATAVQLGTMQSCGRMGQRGPKHKYSMQSAITACF